MVHVKNYEILSKFAKVAPRIGHAECRLFFLARRVRQEQLWSHQLRSLQ